jgi:hypothetical protein
MSYKKDPLIERISNNLAFSSKSTALKNVIGLFDSNRRAQDFFAKLFSLIFKYDNLKELDKLNDIVNHPAIDLGDEKARISFQITTQKDSQKIKDVINTFIDHKLYEKYDRLVVFIIGEKANYTTTFDTKNLFSFDKEKDIWDDNFLFKEIDKLDTPRLEEISAFLEENLLEYKFPENLYPEDIKNCIKILKRDFGGTNMSTILNIQRGDSNFIKDKKNPANNLSWEFFKEKIKGHIKYNDDIFEFLSDPINRDSQKEYLEVSHKIQEFYNDSTNKYTSFENVFGDIFGKLNTYGDNVPGLDIKLKILLHNMYFNCDIGNNHD